MANQTWYSSHVNCSAWYNQGNHYQGGRQKGTSGHKSFKVLRANPFQHQNNSKKHEVRKSATIFFSIWNVESGRLKFIVEQ
jgi:hypothetical protein